MTATNANSRGSSSGQTHRLQLSKRRAKRRQAYAEIFTRQSSAEEPIRDSPSILDHFQRTPTSHDASFAAEAPCPSPKYEYPARWYCMYPEHRSLFYSRKADLRRHYSNAHGGLEIKLLECTEPGCFRKRDKGFAEETELKAHMEEVHRAGIVQTKGQEDLLFTAAENSTSGLRQGQSFRFVNLRDIIGEANPLAAPLSRGRIEDWLRDDSFNLRTWSLNTKSTNKDRRSRDTSPLPSKFDLSGASARHSIRFPAIKRKPDQAEQPQSPHAKQVSSGNCLSSSVAYLAYENRLPCDSHSNSSSGTEDLGGLDEILASSPVREHEQPASQASRRRPDYDEPTDTVEYLSSQQTKLAQILLININRCASNTIFTADVTHKAQPDDSDGTAVSHHNGKDTQEQALEESESGRLAKVDATEEGGRSALCAVTDTGAFAFPIAQSAQSSQKSQATGESIARLSQRIQSLLAIATDGHGDQANQVNFSTSSTEKASTCTQGFNSSSSSLKRQRQAGDDDADERKSRKPGRDRRKAKRRQRKTRRYRCPVAAHCPRISNGMICYSCCLWDGSTEFCHVKQHLERAHVEKDTGRFTASVNCGMTFQELVVHLSNLPQTEGARKWKHCYHLLYPEVELACTPDPYLDFTAPHRLLELFQELHAENQNLRTRLANAEEQLVHARDSPYEDQSSASSPNGRTRETGAHDGYHAIDTVALRLRGQTHTKSNYSKSDSVVGSSKDGEVPDPIKAVQCVEMHDFSRDDAAQVYGNDSDIDNLASDWNRFIDNTDIAEWKNHWISPPSSSTAHLEHDSAYKDPDRMSRPLVNTAAAESQVSTCINSTDGLSNTCATHLSKFKAPECSSPYTSYAPVGIFNKVFSGG